MGTCSISNTWTGSCCLKTGVRPGRTRRIYSSLVQSSAISSTLGKIKGTMSGLTNSDVNAGRIRCTTTLCVSNKDHMLNTDKYNYMTKYYSNDKYNDDEQIYWKWLKVAESKYTHSAVFSEWCSGCNNKHWCSSSCICSIKHHLHPYITKRITRGKWTEDRLKSTIFSPLGVWVRFSEGLYKIGISGGCPSGRVSRSTAESWPQHRQKTGSVKNEKMNNLLILFNAFYVKTNQKVPKHIKDCIFYFLW